MWSLGKNPDPRMVMVLRALRGVPPGVAEGVAPEEREAWRSAFLDAGRAALTRRDFQDELFQEPKPTGPRRRIRSIWSLAAFLVCTLGGLAIGQVQRFGYVSHGRFDNAAINALAWGLVGVLIGLALAVAVLLTKLAVSASRPLRRQVARHELERRFQQLNPARRAEAVEQVLAGSDPVEVARTFGVAPESLEAWGTVYLDAAQQALKERFGLATA